MKYVVREQIFTFADKFNIKDLFGNTKFKVVGRFFSIGNKLNIYDEFGNNVLYIKQKIFRFLSEYRMYEGRKQVGIIKKNISILRPKFTIRSVYGDFKIEGDILRHEFNIVKNNRVVAVVSKRWISLSDNYVVDINDDEDQGFILGIVIVLDQIFYDGKRRKNTNNVQNTGN